MANSSANSSALPYVGRGFDLFLPVIASINLNNFLVSLPTSMTCEDNVCGLSSSNHGNIFLPLLLKC